MELQEDFIPKLPKTDQTDDKSILELAKNGYTIFRNSIPLILAFECLPLANIANVFWLNYAGASEEVVAAYCIAYVWTFSMLNSLFQSLNQGLTVLISQAFGAKEYKLCGAYLHRGLVIDLILMVPFAIILLCSQSILPALGIDANIVNLGMSYVRFAIPAFFGSACFDTLKAFMISQHVFDPIVYIQVSTIGLHFLWSYLTIVVFDWGIAGAGVCRIFEDISNLIILYRYIKNSKKFEKTFTPFESEYLKKETVIEQSKFMIQSGAISYLQFMYFDAMMILAGTFGPIQTIVHTALVQTSSFSFLFCLGTSITESSMIGNAFGGNDIRAAQRHFKGGLFAIITFIILWIIIIAINQQSWVHIWTTDPETTQLYFKTLIIMLFFQTPLDALLQAQIALLRASEKQSFVTHCTLTCWYLIGVPLIIIFAIILDMQVFGLWLSFSIASTVMLVRFILEIKKLNYAQIVKLIQDRIKRNKTDNAIELLEHSQIELHM